MQKKSQIRVCYGIRSVFVILFAMFFSGCDIDFSKLNLDFLKKNEGSKTETVGEAPVTFVAVEVPVHTPVVIDETLKIQEGQTLDEVNALLGPPSGKISMGEKMTYLYNGIMLDFKEGKLVMPSASMAQRVDQRIRERQMATRAGVPAEIKK